jgi:hypothetical protein
MPLFEPKDFKTWSREQREKPKKGGFVVRLSWAFLEKFGVTIARKLGEKKRKGK